MASGKKNYFRHSFFAREDAKIQELIGIMGKEGYFYFFTLLELCGRQWSEGCNERFELHPLTLRSTWVTSSNKLHSVLGCLAQCGLIVHSKQENFYLITIPKFSKYLGLYSAKSETKTPKERKEKEIKEKERKGNKSETPTRPIPKIKQVFDTWNKYRGKLPEARSLTANRKNKITVRLKDFPDHADWTEAVNKIAASDFCNGLNDRGWVADFDFLIKPMSIEKILEGRYDNRRSFSKNEMQTIQTLKENPYAK